MPKSNLHWDHVLLPGATPIASDRLRLQLAAKNRAQIGEGAKSDCSNNQNTAKPATNPKNAAPIFRIPRSATLIRKQTSAPSMKRSLNDARNASCGTRSMAKPRLWYITGAQSEATHQFDLRMIMVSALGPRLSAARSPREAGLVRTRIGVCGAIHWITSARRKSNCGIAIPSAVAELGLITSSNGVDFSSVALARLVPLRILPPHIPAC